MPCTLAVSQRKIRKPNPPPNHREPSGVRSGPMSDIESRTDAAREEVRGETHAIRGRGGRLFTNVISQNFNDLFAAMRLPG